MDLYPGRDLTVMQLLHALNRKLSMQASCTSIRESYCLRQLDEMDASALQTLTRIRAYKNAFSMINRLHPESVARILHFVASECHEGIHGNWRSPYDWIVVTHVCHHWRNIAFSFPSIWSIIDSSCPAMAQLCLDRSKSSPLNIRLSSGCPEDIYQSLKLHTYRVQSLSCRLTWGEQLKLASHLAEVPAPIIRTLMVNVTEGTDTPTPPLPILFKAHMPSLISLRLCGLTFGASVTHVTNLIHLELYNDGPAWIPSLTDFLNVLQANPGLQKLSIVSAGPRSEEGNFKRIVHLQHLRQLIMAKCAVQLILSHIFLPQGARLTVSHIDVSGTGGLLRQTLPTSLVCLRNTCKVEKIGFYRHDANICSFYGSGPNGSVSIKAVNTNNNPQLPAFFGRSFRCFKPLSVSPVRELWLYGVPWGSPVVGKTGWVGKAFGSMMNLENLVLVSCKIESFLRALHPKKDSILCPRLANVILYDIASLKCSELLEVAAARKAQDAPFEMISITCYPGRLASAEDVMLLKEYVKVVEYKVDNEGPKWPFEGFDLGS